MFFWIFFNKTWDYDVIWIYAFSIQKNTNFHSEFYVHFLCEFFVILDYDEMNCNIVSRIFYNVF